MKILYRKRIRRRDARFLNGWQVWDIKLQLPFKCEDIYQYVIFSYYMKIKPLFIRILLFNYEILVSHDLDLQ